MKVSESIKHLKRQGSLVLNEIYVVYSVIYWALVLQHGLVN